jgi:ribosomal protein L7/L12
MNAGIIAAIVIVGMTAAVILARLKALEDKLTMLSRLDAKVDALLKHSGIRFDPYQDVPPAVAAALARGKKIEAIKEYRQARGVGLKEAKEFVEELQRRAVGHVADRP